MKILAKTLIIVTALSATAPLFAQISRVDSKLPWSWSNRADRTIFNAAKAGRTEHDAALLHQAEALLQRDRDMHDGYPKHDLEYYYNSLKAGQQPEVTASVSETKQYDPSLLQLAEAMLQHDKDIHGGYAQHDLDYYYNLLSTKIFVHDENSANAKKEAEYCIYCGEPILQNNQQCTSHAVSQCRTTCPDCGQNLRDEKNLVNGEHRCRFKTRITPAAPKAEQTK